MPNSSDDLSYLQANLSIMLAFRWQSAAQLLAVLQRVPLCNGALFGGEPTVSSKPLLLLTDPAHFEVSYRINPWMQPCAWAKDPAGHLAAAERSFQALATALAAAGARLEIMPGVADLPDMVFPANAAVVLDRRALVARFRHPERQREEQHFQERFRAPRGCGFLLEEVAQFPATCFQEGAHLGRDPRTVLGRLRPTLDAA